MPSLSVEERAAPSEAIGIATIDIATAPWYEWTLLEGIGAARARRIVECRDSIGGFDTLDDLSAVPGMPRDWIDRARPHLRTPRSTDH